MDWIVVVAFFLLPLLIGVREYSRYLNERRERVRLELTLSSICYQLDLLGFDVKITKNPKGGLSSHEVFVSLKKKPNHEH